MGQYIPYNVERVAQLSPYLYQGRINYYQPCLLREFGSNDEAVWYDKVFKLLRGIPNIPKINSGGTFEVPLLLERHVCMDVEHYSVYNFFRWLREIYIAKPDVGKSFFEDIQHIYESVFKDAISGLREILRRKFTPKDFKTYTTVVADGVDGEGRPIYRLFFLDLVPCDVINHNRNVKGLGEYVEGLACLTQFIKDLRDAMRDAIALGGFHYGNIRRQTEHGVPPAILNFLTKAEDLYIEFMAYFDVDYFLNDPWIWSKNYTVIRNRYIFMLFEDNKGADELRRYYWKFPNDWKRNLIRDSFFDRAITTRIREVKVQEAKLDLATKIIDRDSERRLYAGNWLPGMLDYIDVIISAYRESFVKACNQRGLDVYKDESGVLHVGKIKRNGETHYNESAWGQCLPIKTLDEIVEIVDKEFGYSCSFFYWFFNDSWFEGLIPEKIWLYHKAMLKGEDSWQRRFDEDPEGKLERWTEHVAAETDRIYMEQLIELEERDARREA